MPLEVSGPDPGGLLVVSVWRDLGFPFGHFVFLPGQDLLPLAFTALVSSGVSPHLKMMAMTLLALLGTALIAEASVAFPANLQVGDINEKVNLTCDAPAGQRVSWEVEDGALVEMEELPPWGHLLRVGPLDLASARNYTCRGAAGQVLRRTFLAVRDPDFPLFVRKAGKAEAEVTCEAPSYRGTFSCWWKTQHPAAFRARLRPPGPLASGPPLPLSVTGLEQPLQAPYWLLCLRRGPGSARCPAREVSASPGEVRLLLEDCSSPCPFGEKTELELALEGLGEDGSYEALRRDVAIQDIVKPDPPEKLTIHKESGAKLKLSWAPPASWHCASAYFPLRYRLKLEHYDGTQKEVSSDQLEETVQDAEAVHRAKIRCQDPFTSSMWSLWSPGSPSAEDAWGDAAAAASLGGPSQRPLHSSRLASLSSELHLPPLPLLLHLSFQLGGYWWGRMEPCLHLDA
uniref:interleukin-12 subunit beta-like n=1 Tax=Podarcis muralis TaxID=64176 RepID=UPI00109FBD59|nr:interleukin-12 subunit beta-like [Podarcis muralis]